MMIPQRPGVESESLRRRVQPLDRARDAALHRAGDNTDSGGTVVLWHRRHQRIAQAVLGIQPGVSDDLPSLLSTLAAEIGWPGVPAADPGRQQAARDHLPETVVAAWARVWQVRERADLRLLLWWDPAGGLHAQAALRETDGRERPLRETDALVALLDQLAGAPVSSASPHGLLLAGNAAMRDEEYAAARDLYARAIHDLPDHPEAHRNLALAQARLGDWDAATACMRVARQLAPDDPALAQEALALETDAGVQAARRGDLEAAAEHFLRILREQPNEPTALANLGNLRLREGRLREARAIFQRFLTHHATHPAAEKIRLALHDIEA